VIRVSGVNSVSAQGWVCEPSQAPHVLDTREKQPLKHAVFIGWRRGWESNPSPLLKHRNLLILRNAENAKSVRSA